VHPHVQFGTKVPHWRSFFHMPMCQIRRLLIIFSGESKHPVFGKVTSGMDVVIKISKVS
jgi:cyclophilin family peptidyl-prolyl cis-trans isomerase